MLGLALLAGCPRPRPAPPVEMKALVFQALRPELPVAVPSLEAVVAGLAIELPSLSPRTELALAVKDLTTGEVAGFNEEVPHVSASSAKVLWVTAAVARAGLASVAPHAEPIFRASDNLETGAVIDLIGPDAVNDYFAEIGLRHTALTSWSFGKPRKATNSKKEMGTDNYFTARDVVDFLARLDQGALLPPAETEQLRQWMKLTPRGGCGGWLGTLLPARARANLQHKGGWLPPGCCSSDEAYNTLTEVGLVQVPGGHRYAVAVLARRGQDYWGLQAPFVERASCLVYRAIAREPGLLCDFQPHPPEAPQECG